MGGFPVNDLVQPRAVRFAINRTVTPQRKIDDFLAVAKASGAVGIEVRNDVPGREFADGTPAIDLAARIAEAGLSVASINALQRFNDWSREREREAVRLVGYAQELGAPGVVLCPVVKGGHGLTDISAAAKLVKALRALKVIFADHGVTGYVEPLGMLDSTLRRQELAVVAIDEVDGGNVFSICYDTFQYWRARDDKLFPERIGLVHVSGVARTDLCREALTEPDRGLVDEHDITGTVEQLNRLCCAGYGGFISLEPFDPTVQGDPCLSDKLRTSIDYISARVVA